MKTSPVVAAICCFILFSVEVHAESDASMEFTIKGTAEKVCIMPSPSQTGGNNAGLNGQIIEIDDMINDANASLNQASITITFEDVMCNYAAEVVLKSLNGGMIRTSNTDVVPVGDSGNFIDEIDYNVVAHWGSLTLPDFSTAKQSDNYSVTMNAGGANKADLVLDIMINEVSDPVLLGQYQDDLIIEVGPAL